ncbi:MAG: hypothetical protein WCF23_10260, partial [Candidatus Nitrosopolaris sp.]
SGSFTKTQFTLVDSPPYPRGQPARWLIKELTTGDVNLVMAWLVPAPVRNALSKTNKSIPIEQEVFSRLILVQSANLRKNNIIKSIKNLVCRGVVTE